MLPSRGAIRGCPFDWIPSVSSCDFLVCPYSDHSAVSLSVSIPDSIPRGPGFWKLNSAVLEEPGFVNCVHSFWASRTKLPHEKDQTMLHVWADRPHKTKLPRIQTPDHNHSASRTTTRTTTTTTRIARGTRWRLTVNKPLREIWSHLRQ